MEIGSCGSNCFQCKAFLATIEDDYVLNRAPFCHTGCPWKPCCNKHKVSHCISCNEYICGNVNELFNHLPVFKNNLDKYFNS